MAPFLKSHYAEGGPVFKWAESSPAGGSWAVVWGWHLLSVDPAPVVTRVSVHTHIFPHRRQTIRLLTVPWMLRCYPVSSHGLFSPLELQLRRQLSFSEDSDLSSDDILERTSQKSKREVGGS